MRTKAQFDFGTKVLSNLLKNKCIQILQDWILTLSSIIIYEDVGYANCVDLAVIVC